MGFTHEISWQVLFHLQLFVDLHSCDLEINCYESCPRSSNHAHWDFLRIANSIHGKRKKPRDTFRCPGYVSWTPTSTIRSVGMQAGSRRSNYRVQKYYPYFVSQHINTEIIAYLRLLQKIKIKFPNLFLCFAVLEMRSYPSGENVV